MHVRGFTQDGSSGVKNKGTFAGIREKIPYLKELGINAVEMMPIFEFDEMGSYRNYEGRQLYDYWGYNTVCFFAPNTSYESDHEHHHEGRELKQLVRELHENGIEVILDVVFNHTAEGNEMGPYFSFKGIDNNIYYMLTPDGKYYNFSGCGNVLNCNQPIVQQFILDCLRYWVTEYRIDGFRFDLMGVHDIETMNEIRAAIDKIDPSIFMYGEGWAASSPQLEADKLAMKANVEKMPRIAAFSDEMRDGLRGGWDDDTKGAFLVGEPGHEMSIKFGIVGAIEHPQVISDSVNYSKKPWALQPTQMISYVSCHDDMCLADRLKATMPDASVEELAALQKLAETFVFTSQGVPFIFAGDEMMRDKKGVHNSYNSPDSINTIDWKNKTVHKDVFEYVKGLIAMRKAHPAFRMGDADMVRRQLEFLPVKNTNVVAFILKDNANGDSWKNIIVALNSRAEPVKLDIPSGKYTVICKDGKINMKGLGQVSGAELMVPARSAMIIHQ